MSLVHILLLILGVVLLVAGGVRLLRWRAWVDGAILIALGIVVLVIGGFVSV